LEQPNAHQVAEPSVSCTVGMTDGPLITQLPYQKHFSSFSAGNGRQTSAPTLLFKPSHSTLCLKNVPLLTCYNLDVHGSITIIFGTNVTEKVRNQNTLCFPTSSPSVCALRGKTRNPEVVLSFKCCLFTKNTRNALKYHLLTAEPPFTVKTIDWVHQTGPRKGA